MSRARPLLPFVAAVALAACGAPVKTTRIETPAEAVEQLPPGPSLLAARPIDPDRIVRVALGGGHSFAGAPGRGPDGTVLYLPASTLGGTLMFALDENFEVGVVGRLARAGGAGAEGAPPRPTGSGFSAYGARMRVVAGDGDVLFGLATEAGLRTANLAHGVSIACEVEAVGDEWVPIDGTCRASRKLKGRPFDTLDFYLNITVHPTFRLGEGIYLYGGVTLDSVVVGHTRSDVVTEYESGATFTQKSDEGYTEEAVLLPVAGLDLALSDHLGALVMVRGPSLGTIGLPGPYYEAALTLTF